MNYLSPFERFQKERYGNILHEKSEAYEEYEYLYSDRNEMTQWTEKQAEEELNQQNN